MSVIQPIGSLLSIDSDGYLINPCNDALIQPPWRKAVEAVKSAYLHHLDPQSIHSLYLRGSVAKGTAIPHISDIDTFCVTFSENTTLEKAWKKDFQRDLCKTYPFQTGVEMWCIPQQVVLHSPKDSPIKVLIKTQTLCLWGQDLAPQLPPVKPGPALITHTPNLIKELQEVLETLPTMISPSDIQQECQWIMKRIVRTGFELVMEKEQTYTRDLYPCYVAFAKYYPEQSTQMKQALEWAIAPPTQSFKITQFLQTLTSWLTPAINHFLESHIQAF